MFFDYFSDWEVKTNFSKEFISLWDGWLGQDEIHKLDEVTEPEWLKFHRFILMLADQYELYEVDLANSQTKKIECIKSYLPTFEEDQEREYSQFTKLVIPELDAVLTEEWDFTYIFWHKNNGSKEKISEFVIDAGLFSFVD